MNRQNSARPVAIGLTALGMLSRLGPHPWNFTAVGSTSLFAGARLRGWQAYLLPLVLMLITDPMRLPGWKLGGYSIATPFVYAAFLLNVWIGRRLRATESPLKIGSACALCSALFFLISNFGTFLGWYPHTWAGLVDCYALALPFFGGTFAGDLVFSALLFGLHAVLSRRLYTPERVALQAA
jgi:hypothetical protein